MKSKFMAWDKEFKIMSRVTRIDYRAELVELSDGEPYLQGFGRVELMQSTSLKDKNGKEIFEGDVLEIQGIKMIVRFGSYNYIETSKSGTHTLGIMCDGLGFYVECLNVAAPDRISPFEPETLKNSQIVGNTYENKEFLEEKE